MLTLLAKFTKYQHVLLFLGVGIILWTAIGLQLIDHDTPCHRCWEVRGVYLIILELLMLSLMFGYNEPLSIILMLLFIILGNDITVQQDIRHTINITQDQAFSAGYGAYASFLGLSLTLWNLVIANLAILYIAIMNYLQHQFQQKPFVCRSLMEKILTIVWGLSPLLMNAYLFMQT
jgi:disulfide bond formation protein DsbB